MLTSFPYAPVDLGNLAHPSPSLPVLQIQNIQHGPVEMVRNIGYLLIDPFEGVACYSPPRFAKSTSTEPLQCGQATAKTVLPVSLI